MKKQFHPSTNTLRVPTVMQRMDQQQMERTTGGKRRENSFAWRLSYGITLSLYVGPAGFLIALL